MHNSVKQNIWDRIKETDLLIASHRTRRQLVAWHANNSFATELHIDVNKFASAAKKG